MREEQDKITYASVVRDFGMYRMCVSENRHNAGGEFVAFDNNVENLTIPVRYNSFLEGYDYSRPGWLVFCHEDFRFLEPLAPRLAEMDRGVIYGVFGATAGVPGVGLQIDSNRDGSAMSFRGAPVEGTAECDTVDCACLMVHSSLVEKFKLRFDEALTYDLYTEAFSVEAAELHGVKTAVLGIRSHHYSYGSVLERFHRQLAYLNEKWAGARRVYVTTTCYAIGNAERLPGVMRRITGKHRIAFKWLWRRKVTHSGKVLVKVLGITVWSKRRYSFDEWHA